MISLIWTTESENPQDEWEYDWLMSLLPQNKFVIFLNKDFSVEPKENSIIVFNTKTPDRIDQFNAYIKKWDVTFGLIHIGDEVFRCSYHYYLKENCKFIYRNYYDEELASLDKVKFFALGYKKGFKIVVENIDRKYAWSFAGVLDSRQQDRLEGCKTFYDIEPKHFVIETGDSFVDVRSGLSTEDYCRVLRQSKFVLCPIGCVNIDSFRLCEALEAGAIPILKSNSFMQDYKPDNYFERLFKSKNLPFVIHDNWMDCKKEVLELLSDLEKYEERRVECLSFWNSYKKDLKKSLEKDFDELT